MGIVSVGIILQIINIALLGGIPLFSATLKAKAATKIWLISYIIFLPSINVNYDGLKSFIFSAEKLAEKDLKIMWQTKHLPWAPELSEKNKKLSIEKENTDGSVSAAWKTIFSKTSGKK